MNPTAALSPARPWPLRVPASSLAGYSLGCVLLYECTPLPPTLNGFISIPSAMHMPPVPCGPISPLWPVKQSTSMPILRMSIG